MTLTSSRSGVAPELVAAIKHLEIPALAFTHPWLLDDWLARGIVEHVAGHNQKVGTGRHARHGTHFLSVNKEALASYRLHPGDDVSPGAAAWLYAVRETVERDGVVTPAAWCVSCGTGCVDGRVARGHVARIRQWCDRCTKRRHRTEFRHCQAEDCLDDFWTARANQVFCSDACTESQRRRDRGLLKGD